MGALLRIQLKTLGVLLVLATVMLALFYTGVSRVHAATIIRPPNNLGLVGYWSFDEGRGAHAGDFSGSGNDGALNGNPQWVSGRSNGALEFDGNGDYVDVGGIGNITNEITIGFWSFPRSGGSNIWTGVIHSGDADNTNEWGINFYDGSNEWRITHGGTYPLVNVAAPYSVWQHIVIIDDGTEIRLYKDGLLADTYSGSFTWDLTGVNMGKYVWRGENRYHDGTIDDVRMYNRALSAAEILSLYDNTKSTIVGITPVDRYTDGLVGHWTFDGKHTTATNAGDVAGSNDGTISGAVPTIGLIGQAMMFDGVSDNVKLASSNDLNITGDITVSSWIYLDPSFSNAASVVHKGDHYSLHIRANRKITWADSSMWSYANFGDHGEVPLGQWTHIMATKEGSIVTIYMDGQVVVSKTFGGGSLSQDLSVAHIGCYAGNTGGSSCTSQSINGSIDDVRIYSRALSATEVVGLYSATTSSKMQSSTDELVTSSLAGHWSFDAGTVNGTSVTDVSGNGNTGTLIGNTNQVSGKIREALVFDGDGDVVDTSMRPNEIDGGPVSFFTWVKIAPGAAVDGRQKIFSGYAGGADRWDFEYISNKLRFAAYGAGVTAVGATTLNEDTWYNVGFVWTPGQDVKLYFNGVEDGSDVVTNLSLDDGVNFHIGGRAGLSEKEWEGLIDDVRIYNRALTEEEITQLYSMGQ